MNIVKTIQKQSMTLSHQTSKNWDEMLYENTREDTAALSSQNLGVDSVKKRKCHGIDHG